MVNYPGITFIPEYAQQHKTDNIQKFNPYNPRN
jgi:hypothetical protein